MTKTDDNMRVFVRQVLGCGCPDEVLRTIRRSMAGEGANERAYERVDLGGRLLLYLLQAVEPRNDPGQLAVLLRAGIADRDRHGFNRFRLVVPAVEAQRADGIADATLTEVPTADDKVHVHVVDASCMPAPHPR